ncbi:MAG: hypothetical protein FWH20_11555, partial [Oscillospiraceae bacterium]|nr:hypothetical protein [Oscillospiraceae bacterium]
RAGLKEGGEVCGGWAGVYTQVEEVNVVVFLGVVVGDFLFFSLEPSFPCAFEKKKAVTEIIGTALCYC